MYMYMPIVCLISLHWSTFLYPFALLSVLLVIGAKGDVLLRFGAEDAGQAAAIKAFQKGIEDSADSARKMAATVAKSGDSIAGMGTSVTKALSSLTSLAAGYAVVTKGIELASEALAGYQKQQDEKSKGFVDQNKSLSTALANTGHIGNFTQANNQIDSIQTNAFDKAGKTAMMVDAIQRTKGEFSQEEYGKALGASVKYGETGATNTGAFGATRLQLGKAAGMKGSGWEKIDDKGLDEMTASVMSRNPEGLSDQDLKFLYRAKNKDLAFAGISALRASSETDKGGQKLMELAGATPSKEEEKKWKIDKQLSEEERAKKRIFQSGNSPEERFAAIMQHPEIVSQADRSLAQNVAREFHPNQRSAAISAAPLETALGEKEKLLKSDPGFKTLTELEKAEIKAKAIAERDALKAAQKKLRNENQTNFFAEHVTDNPLAVGAFKFATGVEDTVQRGDLPKNSLKKNITQDAAGWVSDKIVDLLTGIKDHAERGADAQHKTATAVNGGAALKPAGVDR